MFDARSADAVPTLEELLAQAGEAAAALPTPAEFLSGQARAKLAAAQARGSLRPVNCGTSMHPLLRIRNQVPK
jgi:hypothetical protein